MKKLGGFTLVALLILALVDLVLSVCFTGSEGYKSEFRPSYSMLDSKARDAFVEPISISPVIINWRGKRIVIKEAWLEHRTQLVQVYVIVPFIIEYRDYRKFEGYNLCFNLAEGWDVLWEHDGPFFVVEGKGKAFGTLGRVVLWHDMGNLQECPTKILVTDNWKFENSLSLEAKKIPR